MIANCVLHDVEMEERQSKSKFDESGNPKTYFGHMADGKMCFGKADRATNGGGYSKPAPQPKANDPDWDEIARGKVRCQVAVAFIGNLENPASTDEHLIDAMETWVEYIMDGVKED